MKRTKLFAAASAAFLLAQLFAGSAGAVVVLHDESVNGDLVNNDDGTPQTLVLDPTGDGINRVLGTSSIDTSFNPAVQDFDDFILTVPAGYLLTGAALKSWTFTTPADIGSSSITSVQMGLAFYSGDTAILANRLNNDNIVLYSNNGLTEATQPLSMFTLPVGAGNYLVNQFSLGITNGIAAVFDYEWEFTVSPVPLPPAAWLFISGLLAMVGLSRRQRAAAS